MCDTAETLELWQAVEGDGSLVESRGRVSVGFEESVGFDESAGFDESFRFGRIFLFRVNLADFILPADSFMRNAVLDRDVRNDEMPAFRGLISGVECSSRFAAPGDVSRIV